MRSFLLPIILCLAFAGSVLAADITPDDAAKHVGEKVTVRGTVAQAIFTKGKSAYLNFGGRFPNQVFSVVVLSTRTPVLLAGGPAWLTDFQGKDVVVAGTIEMYESKPQIVLAAKEDVSLAPAK